MSSPLPQMRLHLLPSAASLTELSSVTEVRLRMAAGAARNGILLTFRRVASESSLLPPPRSNRQIFVPCTKTQCFSQLCFHFLREPRARWRSANCSRVGTNSPGTPAEGKIKLTSGCFRRRARPMIYGAAVTLNFRS